MEDTLNTRSYGPGSG